jgi:hypothetical protein
MITLAVVAAVGLVAGCADQTVAIRFGDQTVTQADFLDELEALVARFGEEGPAQPGEYPRGELQGSYDQEFAAQVLTQRLEFMVFGRIFDDEGMEITDADRDRVRSALEIDPGFQGLPEDYRARLIDDLVKRQMVQDALAPARLNEMIRELLNSTDVEVHSRYGSWSMFEGLVPPEGPLQPGSPQIPDDVVGPTGPPEG